MPDANPAPAQPWKFRPIEVAEAIRLGLAEMLGPALGHDKITVELSPPPHTPEQAQLLRICSTGTGVIRWAGNDEQIGFPVPWPHEGVFLLRSDRTWRVDRWRWHPRLVLPPGVHFVRRFLSQGLHAFAVADRTHKVKCAIRSERSRAQPAKAPNPAAVGADRKERANPVYLPPALRAALSQHGIIALPLPTVIDWLEVEDAFTAWCSTNKVADALIRDAKDIQSSRLFTYNVHVEQAVLRTIARLIWKIPEAMSAIKGEAAPSRGASKVWGSLVKAASDAPWLAAQPLVDEGLLVRFEPLNGIDAISGLTAFQRYDAPSSDVERMAAWRRQNHASFEGFVCPVESPETKKVGITLHLAQRCRVTVWGELHAADDHGDDRSQALGYAASLVPFAQHNDGVRCMMGAKNLKQAVRVRCAETPALLTGSESAIRDGLLRPLRDAGILSNEERTTALGTDLLVAYLPWYGWNADDAIVAHERLRDLLAWEDAAEHQEFVRPGVGLCDPPGDGPWAPLHQFIFEGGLRKPGSVGPGDAVAWLRDDTTGRVYDVPSRAKPGAVLEEIDFQPPPHEGFGGHLRWRLRQNLPLGVGDKLMGRHGNKGVVSILLPENQLPRLPDHEALPASLRGRAVDLVLNPNGVVSRMNLGQLIESHAGLLGRMRPDLDLSGLAAPFAFDSKKQAWLASQFMEIERETGGLIDRYGRPTLLLPTRSEGEPSHAVRVVAGWQYFVRLKHIPVEKANARRGGAGYPYNLTTGQPVAGRKHRGGQRLGEMEVWALAAHEASKNLGEVLGPRSDPTWAKTASTSLGSPTLCAVRDHLRAIGIALESDAGKMKLRWLASSDIADAGREATSGDTWRIATGGEYRCGQGCGYHLGGLVGTRKAQRKEHRQASVADAIRDHLFDGRSGLTVQRSDTSGRADVTLALRSTTGQSKEVAFDLSKKKRNLTARFTLGRKQYAAYQQIDGAVDETDAELLLGMRLTCPEHATSILEIAEGRSVLWPEAGGVCDPELAGEADLTSVATVQTGFIRLPFPVYNPLNRALPRGAKRLPDVECVPLLALRHRHAFAPRNLAKHQPAVDPLTRIYADLVTHSSEYRDHIDAEPVVVDGGDDDQKVKWARRTAWIAGSIRELVDAIYQHVIGDVAVANAHGRRRRQRGLSPEGRLFGKLGLLRYDGLGRRVDKSGRLVIVPDPTLALDECRLPHLFLLELLLDELLADEDERAALQEALKGLSQDLSDRPSKERSEHGDQKEAGSGERRPPPLPALIQPDAWREALASGTALVPRLVEATAGTVRRHLEDDGDARVLLNRQPTLHRYNLLAFRPRPPKRVGDAPVLRLSPLACAPFNADFDGDEMAVHAPIDSDARDELQAMSFGSPKNRVSLADSSPVVGFGQELALGHFLLSAAGSSSDLWDAVAEKVLVSGCTTCTELSVRSPDSHKALLTHLLLAHGAEALSRIRSWAEVAWAAATRSGIGFGWLEIVDRVGVVEFPGCAPEEVNGHLEEQTRTALREALRQGADAPIRGLAALVLSGARGDAKQVRQLIGPRGWLAPGDVDDLPAAAFLIRSSLSTGMDWSDFFWSSFNARSSMVDKKLLVAQAGALTRRLVLACWPWRIGAADCGASGTRSLVTCAQAGLDRKVCAACYGDVESLGGRLHEGFPVGLIAAQSIGERGTQLSMQSFHTGERAMTPRRLVDLFERRGEWKSKPSVYESPEGYTQFVNWIRQNVTAYARLDDRHFAMLWLAIHKSPETSLKSAWSGCAGPLALLAGTDQLRDLIAAVGRSDDLAHPVVRILAGLV